MPQPSVFFFFTATSPTALYTLSLHDALPIEPVPPEFCPPKSSTTSLSWVGDFASAFPCEQPWLDRKSTRLNSSHVEISFAVFCLKKKNKHNETSHPHSDTITHSARTQHIRIT